MKHLFKIFAVLTILCFGLTLIPLWNNDHWLIRLWDFPRFQILLVAVLAFTGMIACHYWSAATKLYTGFLGLVALAVVVIQGTLIAPYTPVFRNEVAGVKPTLGTRAQHDCLRILIANLYMKNRDAAPIIETIKASDPDIVFIVENDSWWSEKLSGIASRYPVVLDHPLNNTYGLLFMTRLAADHVSLEHLVKPDVPSVTALLRLPDTGRRFHFHGVHPEPPMLGQDSTPRDQELLIVAERVRALRLPAVIGGDLNDVAWSHTTRLFRRVSRALDPRVGRGTFSSFHADYPFARWPLDHVFHTDEFELGAIGVLPDINSDHFPLSADLCFAGDRRERNRQADKIDQEDVQEVEDTLDKPS